MAASPAHNNSKARPAATGSKPPISASPVFPWVVALWFAALLGVGSLIVPVTLLERASVALGVASVLPQAAPPLGFTAQMLVAVAGTVGGALLGWFLARRVAGPKQEKPARRIFRALEDIDDDGIAAAATPQEPGARRRTLAMAEEEGPSDFLNVVPLPGTAEAGDTDAGIEFVAEPVAEPEPADEPHRDFAPPKQADPVEAEEPFELDLGAELTEVQPAEEHPAEEFSPPEPQIERQEFTAPADTGYPAEAQEEQEKEVEEPAPAAEPLAFSPPSMAQPEAALDETGHAAGGDDSFGEDRAGTEFGTFAASVPEAYGSEDESTLADKQIFDAPGMAADAPPVPEGYAAQPDGEPQGEGLVQLVQRLGATLEKHREWAADQASTQAAEATAGHAPQHAAEAPVPQDFDPAAADDAAEAMAAWFGKSAGPASGAEANSDAVAPADGEAHGVAEEAPAQMRYEAFPAMHADDGDEDDDDIAELAASFSLPLGRKPAAPEPHPALEHAPEAGDADEEDEDDTATADGFASLNPFKRNAEEFVRIDEPEPEPNSAEPAVLFPGQEERKAARPAPIPRAFDPPAGDADQAPQANARPQPSNDDNERALREALLNLQRMSK